MVIIDFISTLKHIINCKWNANIILKLNIEKSIFTFQGEHFINDSSCK
jgi:hypothetical protein